MDKVVQRWFGILLFTWHLAFATTATAADCKSHTAKIVSVQGEIEVKRAGTSNWHPVDRNDVFCPGDSIRVGEKSRAAIVMANETLLRLDQNSAIKFTQFETEVPSILGFIRGIGHFISRLPRSLKIETATVDAAIEGTEFVIAVSADETSVTVFEGTVLAQNPQGELRITDGETAIAEAKAAPRKTLLARPRDTVQWAVYFPPVIEMDKPDNVSSASQLLAVGRVEEAQRLLQGIDSGEALALRTVIAIVNNEQQRAFDFATEAVRRAPQSAAAHIAMSYAWQAKLNLDQALASARLAVEYEPRNAIAWARLAELQLSVGELREALASAQQAIKHDATLSRTQSILGYAYLARIDIKEAIAAFNSAIELNQVDPLPRLGLGLGKIRKGKLNEGRREIEIATSLDPNNAIIRSYLGKAYFEEKRAPLDAEQFTMSKELDPNDPTPYFYDAIRKQTENDPVGALENLNRSIELNDNRAIYRSRLLLHQDEAARSSSLARIYSDLGFQQLALVEGWKSVNTNPASHSAHRFLADTYSSLPRHEIARVSELLQAQLLQPINNNPLQPQLAESNLAILDGAGPSDLSFNEFNPLFTRDRISLLANGVVGGNGTLGNDLVISGIQSKLSYSLGQFHYETAGFRENNDYEQNIYNVFTQISMSHKSSVQLELRSSEIEHGDIQLRFDPDNFSDNLRHEINKDSARLGFHYASTPTTDWIASLVFQNDKEAFNQQFVVTPALLDIRSTVDLESYTAELRYIHRSTRFNVTWGVGHFEQDGDRILTTDSTVGAIFVPGEPQITATDSQNDSIYVYSQIKALPDLTWTIGASFDDFESEESSDVDQFNPKIGLMWDITPATTLRLAAFRVLKRPILSDQTVEPTSVAGFNQFFDDLNGTDSRRYGIGLDHKFSNKMFAGLEFSRRDLEAPVTANVALDQTKEDLDERLYRAYWNWTPNPKFAISADYLFEGFDREFVPVSTDPKKTDTHYFPVSLSFFHANSLSANLTATYVDQEVELPSLLRDTVTGEDDFWTVDASIGYRLPKRFGILSIGVKNLFDEEFKFQDTNFRNSATKPSLLQPSRIVLGKFTLSF